MVFPNFSKEDFLSFWILTGVASDSKPPQLYPINLLAENAPVYDREWKKTKLPQKLKINKDHFKSLNLNDCLKKILKSPNISNKQWIWDQYDQNKKMVGMQLDSTKKAF